MNAQVTLISFVVGLVIPALTSLVTREHISQKLRALLTAMLAAVGGGLTGAIGSPPAGWHQWQTILWGIGLAWVSAGVIYFTGYNATGPSVARFVSAKTASFGIGPEEQPPAADEAGHAQPSALIGFSCLLLALSATVFLLGFLLLR